MSTKLKQIKNLSLTSLWGGVNHGPCVQVTIPNIEYEKLTHHEVGQLLKVLFQWYFAHTESEDKS